MKAKILFMSKALVYLLILLLFTNCYVPSAVYKEVNEYDPYTKSDIIRQRDNGIMGTMNECNACWFYFDIIYNKVEDTYSMFISYSGDNWLFINQVIFLLDGENLTFPFKGDRDVGYDVYEWDSIMISKENINKIINAKEVSCRLSGKYSFDLSSNDMKSIRKNWKNFAEGSLKQYLQ